MNTDYILIVLGEPYSVFSEIIGKYTFITHYCLIDQMLEVLGDFVQLYTMFEWV